MEKLTLTISDIEAGQRLDKYLKKIMPTAPQSFIYKLIRIKDIKINNKKTDAAYILEEDDIVSIFLTEKQVAEFIVPYTFTKIRKPFTIIYEDENILVINKDAGLLVHASEFENELTLTNMVLTYLHDRGKFDPQKRGYIPSPVSRIDRDTSGVVIFSKKQSVHQALAGAFTRENEVIRLYRLVVYGTLKTDEGIIALPLKRENGQTVPASDGQNALTTYEVIKRGVNKTYVEVALLTGRQHQIRAHFKAIGHPLVGDAKYGNSDEAKPLALNAYKVVFTALSPPLDYLNGQEFIADNTAPLLQELGE
ncbi:MAG: Ribosomal large subunit pseudouridine synthase C [Tenericutes bacterium ADurb.Bin087]|nr:MAG: Ribosomal large subunit pseudouridine synthase C [Tenericutes bacterium ADurb.Bin087]